MVKQSAGLLLYRTNAGELEVLLVHPGGPFWVNKDDGAWSIPKGEFTDAEDPLAAALREFEEETGMKVSGEPVQLETVRQSGGKVVHAWAVQGDFDPATLKSNMFTMEWPPKSGKQEEFPEVDRAAWFTIAAASAKILKGQLPFLTRLQEKIVSD